MDTQRRLFCPFSMRVRKVAVALICVGPIIASAQFSPTVEDVCTDDVINNRKLVGQLFKYVNIADIDISPDGEDTSYADRLSAIFGDQCKKATCSDSVKHRLDLADQLLIEFLERSGRPLSPNESGVEITMKGDRRRPSIDSKLFLESPDLFESKCVAVAADPLPTITNTSTRNSDGNWLSLSSIRIRENPMDLTVSRGDQLFKGVKGATFSVDHDFRADNSTYGIDAAVGISNGREIIGNSTYAEAVPYISYKRQYVDGNNPQKITNLENVTVGVSNDVLFKFGIYHDLKLMPKYVNSLKAGSELLSVDLVYTPMPKWFGIGQYYYPLGNESFALIIRPQIKFTYGDVLDDGGKVELRDTNEFGRSGPRLEANILGLSGLLSGVGLNVAYDHLFGFKGQFSTVRRLETDLTYTFPDSEWFSIALKYVQGRDLDTLDKQRALTLGFAVKY